MAEQPGREVATAPSDLRCGDPAVVFAELFDAYAPGLHRYLSRRVGNVADDLVAETFLAALAGRDGYDPLKAEPGAWLYGIASNLLRRHFRQELRRLSATAKAAYAELPGADPADAAHERIDAQAQVGRLAAGIAALSEHDRDVLLLTAWAGLDSNQVAQALGIPVGTVRSRLHRVRRQLRMNQPSAADESHQPGDLTGGER